MERKPSNSPLAPSPEGLTPELSATRLRIGFVLIVLFWLPFWLIAPLIYTLANVTSATDKSKILVLIIVAQSIMGVLGVIIVGKPIANIVRHTSKRKTPKVIWHTLTSGKIN
jgi:hypothetical protein